MLFKTLEKKCRIFVLQSYESLAVYQNFMALPKKNHRNTPSLAHLGLDEIDLAILLKLQISGSHETQRTCRSDRAFHSGDQRAASQTRRRARHYRRLSHKARSEVNRIGCRCIHFCHGRIEHALSGISRIGKKTSGDHGSSCRHRRRFAFAESTDMEYFNFRTIAFGNSIMERREADAHERRTFFAERNIVAADRGVEAMKIVYFIHNIY